MPSLRFPEFLNDREWELVHIGRYYKLQGGFAFKSCYFKDSGIPIIRIANIPNDGAFVDTSNCVCYEAIANDSNYIVSMGDLLIAMSGATIGKTAIFHEPHNAYLNQRVGLFKSINVDNYYPFLCQWVKSECFSRQLKRTLAAGAQPNISSKDIESFIWAYPIGNSSNKEQRKIADCLTSLDRYIYNTKSKLQQLKAHKRGLIQRLFPARGKTVPELRFTEFRNDGEWEIKKLRDIATLSKGKGISKTDVTANGTTPCIRYGELYTTYKETITDVSSYTDLPVTDLFLSKANDVIIPSSGETKEDIATASCIIKDGIAIGGDINVIRTSNNGIFLSYYLTYVKKNDIARIAQGVSIIHLYNEQLRDLVVELPNSIKEQQRIADCLQSVDNVIKSYEDKITALELHKKGLMQQLFPKL